MLYEMETTPLANKITPNSPTPASKLKEQSPVLEINSLPYTNGTTKVYGPELPPNFNKCNGAISNGMNGESSECESVKKENTPIPLPSPKLAIKFHNHTQSPVVSTSENGTGGKAHLPATPKTPTAETIKDQMPPGPRPQTPTSKLQTPSTSKLQTPSTSNTLTKTEKAASVNSSPTAKLVPYDVDDSSSASEDSVKVGLEKRSAVVELKASTGK